MLTEISYAVDFLGRLIPESAAVPPELREGWKDALTRLLSQRFQAHWNVTNPFAGNAYRAVTTFAGRLDRTLVAAAEEAGLSMHVLATYLPRDLVLWIDPYSVSYRIRDNSAVFALYEDKSQHQALGLKSTADFCISNASPTPVLIRAPPPASSAGHGGRPHSNSLSSTATAVSMGGRRMMTPSPQRSMGSVSPSDDASSPTSSTVSSPKTPPNVYQRLPPPGLSSHPNKHLHHTMQQQQPGAHLPGGPRPLSQQQQASPPSSYFPPLYTNTYTSPAQGNTYHHYMHHQPPTSQMYC